MFNISSNYLRIIRYLRSLATYILTLTITFYILITFTSSSLTYIYYMRYNYQYYTIMILYISSVLLFIFYITLYLSLPKYNLIKGTAVIASISLVITNYSYLITYSMTNQLTMSIYPAVIMISDNSSNSVVVLDWGQIALIPSILRLVLSTLKSEAFSRKV